VVSIPKDIMFYRFSLYGFLKNLRLFEPFLILFFLSSGLSYTEIGILYATAEISTNILEIPTGIFADIFGRKKSMLLGFSAYLLSFTIFYFTNIFYMFIVAMILFGLGDAFRSGTHKAMILEYLKIKGISDKKVEYYGATRSASQFGSAINSLIAGVVVFYTGDYHLIFLITLIPYILDFINLATYPPELDREYGKIKIAKQTKRTLKDFKGIFRNKDALKAILNSSIYDSSFKATKDYLQPILKSFALSIPLLILLTPDRRTAVIIGIIYFFLYLLSSYSSKKSYLFVKKFKSISSAINTTYLIGAILIIIAGLSYHALIFSAAIISFILVHILFNVRRPMNVSYVSDKISHRVMASGLSVESQFKMIFSATFAFLIGVLSDHFGVGSALFVIGLIVLLTYPAGRVGEK